MGNPVSSEYFWELAEHDPARYVEYLRDAGLIEHRHEKPLRLVAPVTFVVFTHP